MNRFSARKFSLSTAAAAIALGAGATAFAGGYYGGYYGGHGGGYYSAGYSGGHHGGHGFRGRHHRRGHGGGGKAAAIALGVIGGAIILNEISEDRARQRAYDDRYDRRNRRYSRRSEPIYIDRDYLPQRDYDSAPQDGNLSDDDLDARLEGRGDGGPEPIRLSYRRAYKACLNHARAALSNRGFVLASPARPETVEETGRAWKMTANVTAQNQRGDTWTRAMYCEADDNRVYLLELI